MNLSRYWVKIEGSLTLMKNKIICHRICTLIFKYFFYLILKTPPRFISQFHQLEKWRRKWLTLLPLARECFGFNKVFWQEAINRVSWQGEITYYLLRMEPCATCTNQKMAYVKGPCPGNCICSLCLHLRCSELILCGYHCSGYYKTLVRFCCSVLLSFPSSWREIISSNDRLAHAREPLTLPLGN